jgi:hypothetical protein
MDYATIKLDMDAQELYHQFSGLEDRKKYYKLYLNEQARLNQWQKSMVEFVYYLAAMLNSSRLSDTSVKNKEDIRPLIERLGRLAEIPQRGKEKKIIIRHRGLGLVHHKQDHSPDTELDYVISCGDCIIDRPYLDYLYKMNLMDDPGLAKKLDKAFRFFSLAGIYIIEIKINDWLPQDKQLINKSLLFWAKYYTEYNKGASSVIYNEKGQPDPNLTIVARLNRIKKYSFQELIKTLGKEYLN